MTAIIDLVTTQFVQTNTIVKGGRDLLQSGELTLANLGDASVAITCYIGKKKKTFSQEIEGNVNSFQSYVMAKTDVSPTIAAFDLIVTERGDKFLVGPVSIRNENTDINSQINEAAYLYADLELYEDIDEE